MSNIVGFLEEYGGVPFEREPFCEADSLVLCQLSYSDLETARKPAPLNAVAAVSKGMFQHDGRLLAALARSERYRDILLTDYVNQIDPDECKQFSAVTAILPDGTAFVAYRGTDNTIVGWKEDFNLAFATPVPAQREAISYLERAAERFPGKLRVGGHSKGGNLAIYASAMCAPEIQERLLSVNNNDGPGQDANVLRSEGYQRVADRVRTLIPQSSIIGMLLEHTDDYDIVRSNSTGIFQHSLYTWQTAGTSLERMDRRTRSSVHMDEAIRTWLTGMSMEKRRRFTDSLFALFSSGETTTFMDLLTNWKNAPARLAEWTRLGKEDGPFLFGLFGELAETAYQVYRRAALEEAEEWKAGFSRFRADWGALAGAVKALGAEEPAAKRSSEGEGALYKVSGTVAHGKRIGGTIGFPTANLPLPPDGNRPENGVYIAEMRVSGEPGTFVGVLNQGLHPTFPDGEPSVEMHILNGNPDLYGKSVSIRYLRFLRAEKRFSSAAALAAQITEDIAAAREWLNGRYGFPFVDKGADAR